MNEKLDISQRVPKLRFPEFRGEEGWEQKQLGEVAELISGLHLSPDEYNRDRIGIPYFSGPSDFVNSIDLANKWTNKVDNAGKYGDILITVKGNGVGTLIELKLVSVAIGRQLMAIRPIHIVGSFIYQLLLVRKEIFEVLASGNMIPGLSRSIVLKLKFPISRLPEQQKIADCLSSLDELLAAHSKKLDSLKAHKKGLMQQLFPAEGETAPRLRFPEFREAVEWEETRLSELGTTISGLTYSPQDIRRSGLLVLRSSNVYEGAIRLDDCVFVRSDIKGANLAEPNDILICVRNGSNSLIGKNAIIPKGMPDCTHGAFMTVFRAKLPGFAFQLLQTKMYKNQVEGDLGARINSINSSRLLRYKFFVPGEEEQQKIADCLSSLDALITAQTQKIEALKQHKKGLMQQLFPSAEGAEG